MVEGDSGFSHIAHTYQTAQHQEFIGGEIPGSLERRNLSPLAKRHCIPWLSYLWRGNAYVNGGLRDADLGRKNLSFPRIAWQFEFSCPLFNRDTLFQVAGEAVFSNGIQFSERVRVCRWTMS